MCKTQRKVGGIPPSVGRKSIYFHFEAQMCFLEWCRCWFCPAKAKVMDKHIRFPFGIISKVCWWVSGVLFTWVTVSVILDQSCRSGVMAYLITSQAKSGLGHGNCGEFVKQFMTHPLGMSGIWWGHSCCAVWSAKILTVSTLTTKRNLWALMEERHRVEVK